MSASGTITAGAAQELLAVLTKRRPKSCDINARAGIPRAALQQPLGMLPLVAFTSMLEVAAYEFGNSTLGLELGSAFKLSSMGPVSRLMQTAPTVGDALEKFTLYFGSVQTNTRSTLTVSNGVARLAYAISDQAIRFRVQDAGFTLAFEHAMLATFLGAKWQASCVEFEHSAGDDIALYQRHFACPLRFGQRENALIFPAQLLDTPLREADATLHARLEADLADSMQLRTVQLDFIQSIEAWVAATLCRSESTDIDSVASDFGMSTRSFQRRLAEHDISYLDIRNRARAGIAKCMLAETRIPVTSVALHLGYSETSAFSRGFKALVGETPLEFRRREKTAA